MGEKRIEPLKVLRKPRKIDMELLKKDVEKNPNSYQREGAKKFNVSKTFIYHTLKRLKVTCKKKLSIIVNKTQKKDL